MERPENNLVVRGDRQHLTKAERVLAWFNDPEQGYTDGLTHRMAVNHPDLYMNQLPAVIFVLKQRGYVFTKKRGVSTRGRGYDTYYLVHDVKKEPIEKIPAEWRGAKKVATVKVKVNAKTKADKQLEIFVR